MSNYSDAAMLRGDYSKMLKEPPKEADWKKVSCTNGAEEAAQALAKQIFAFRKSIDPTKEKLEVVAFSAFGPIRVVGIMPMEGELMLIQGVDPKNSKSVSMVQHFGQLSLSFTTAPVKSDNPLEKPDNDDGMQIGYVIFDELKERKKGRKSPRRRKTEAGK